MKLTICRSCVLMLVRDLTFLTYLSCCSTRGFNLSMKFCCKQLLKRRSNSSVSSGLSCTGRSSNCVIVGGRHRFSWVCWGYSTSKRLFAVTSLVIQVAASSASKEGEIDIDQSQVFLLKFGTQKNEGSFPQREKILEQKDLKPNQKHSILFSR